MAANRSRISVDNKKCLTFYDSVEHLDSELVSKVLRMLADLERREVSGSLTVHLRCGKPEVVELKETHKIAKM